MTPHQNPHIPSRSSIPSRASRTSRTSRTSRISSASPELEGRVIFYDMPDVMFHLEKVRSVLARHNACWGALLRNWHERGGVAWTPGMIVTPELRGWVESFLPWRDFARSLRGVARAMLPDESWVPQLLQDDALPSLPEFWEELPEYLGRVEFALEELLPFFCACADPPRFGTDVGRYPEQLAALRERPLAPSGRLLDLGCGVGLGTLEAVAALGLSSGVGVTVEPLEAWMAQRRWLPHDVARSRHFAKFSQVPAHFVAGDVLEYSGEGGFAVILCNGLAGGRFLQSEAALQKLLAVFQAQLVPGGVAALANAFHEGQRPHVERLLALARAQGWQVAGSWRNAVIFH